MRVRAVAARIGPVAALFWSIVTGRSRTMPLHLSTVQGEVMRGTFVYGGVEEIVSKRVT